MKFLWALRSKIDRSSSTFEIGPSVILHKKIPNHRPTPSPPQVYVQHPNLFLFDHPPFSNIQPEPVRHLNRRIYTYIPTHLTPKSCPTTAPSPHRTSFSFNTDRRGKSKPFYVLHKSLTVLKTVPTLLRPGIPKRYSPRKKS